MKRAQLALHGALSILSTTAFASAPDTEAVEFYNSVNRHFFITAVASEASVIDKGGAGPGWVRTGRTFQAWLGKSTAPARNRRWPARCERSHGVVARWSPVTPWCVIL